MFIPRGELRKQNPNGVKLFYLGFNFCLDKVLYLSNIPHYIGFFEILKMLYPPIGAAKVEPEWGPIVFT